MDIKSRIMAPLVELKGFIRYTGCDAMFCTGLCAAAAATFYRRRRHRP